MKQVSGDQFMNRKQVEAEGNQAEHKSGNLHGKSGTVLGEINDDNEKQGDEAQVGPADTGGSEKNGDKDTVLGEINDDARKQKK